MKKLSILLVLILLLQPAYAVRHITKVQYSPEIKNGFKIYSDIEYRYNGDDIEYRHYDGGIRFPIKYFGEGWQGGAQFRAIYTKSDDGSWDLEKRPHFQLQKAIETAEYNFIPELTWKFRTRHEYRVRESGNDTARNRLKISVKSNEEYYGLKPFISDEIFYDFDKKDWIRNRMQVGVDLPKFKKVSSSVAYRLEANLVDDDWDYTSSVNFAIKF
jgi:hypothetical protein